LAAAQLPSVAHHERMQFGLRIEHRLPSYVEEQGGWEFYSHVRAGRSRAEYRRRALLRATQTYRRLYAGGDSELLCGAALLVIQRAAFCAEDLGGLLHALSDTEDRFKRLTSAGINHLDAVYAQVMLNLRQTGPVRQRSVLAPFCIGPDKLIQGETDVPKAWRDACVELAEICAVRWLKKMQPVASFWANYHDLAKATMHGYPMLAGRHVFGPPAAGWLAEHVTDPGVPFAVSLGTNEPRPQHLETAMTVIRCEPASIEPVQRAGRHAADVYEDLCSQQATTIETTAAVSIPGSLAHRLSDAQRKAFIESAQR
jgi:hypothetical protein